MAANQLEVLTFAYVPASVLDGGVAVDIGKQTETESVLVIGRVCKAVNQNAAGRGVERLPHPVVELVVSYGAPVLRLFITNRPHI